jgi:hypothetical protein
MTLPDERYRALKNGEQFLLDLCNPKVTPKVPTAVRDRARGILKHFPTKYDIDRIADALPYFISNKPLWDHYSDLPAPKAYEDTNENSN